MQALQVATGPAAMPAHESSTIKIEQEDAGGGELHIVCVEIGMEDTRGMKAANALSDSLPQFARQWSFAQACRQWPDPRQPAGDDVCTIQQAAAQETGSHRSWHRQAASMQLRQQSPFAKTAGTLGTGPEEGIPCQPRHLPATTIMAQYPVHRAAPKKEGTATSAAGHGIAYRPRSRIKEGLLHIRDQRSIV